MSQKILTSVCFCVLATGAFAGTKAETTLTLRATAINGVAVSPDPGEVFVTPGDALTVEMYLDGWAPHKLRAYQLTLSAASLTSGSAGALLALTAGSHIDEAREDFAFAGFSTNPNHEEAFALLDSQSSGFRWGAGLFETAQGVDDPGTSVYVGTLTLAVSPDAAGSFVVGLDPQQTFLRNAATPPGDIPVIQQSLAIGIGECALLSDCGDLDGNGVRDNACAWYSCQAGSCSVTPRTTHADLGGPNGQCPLDDACDGNDRFHALNCFSNRSTSGAFAYPCEQAPPGAVNVDAGGPGVACALDGVCDANDAFHALNCFENINSSGTAPYPCGCGGPSPEPAVPYRPRDTASTTGVILRGPAKIQAGDVVEVDVYTTNALKSLRGYQLHAGVRGGQVSTLELVDILVDGARPDFAFARQRGAWTAMNRDIQQVAAGLDAVEGTAAGAAAYLATFVYRVPPEARGTFVVDLRHSKGPSNAADRTFLFGRFGSLIRISATEPAVIAVTPRHRSTS